MLGKAEIIEISFEEGVPTEINGELMGPLDIIQECNKVAGMHGISRLTLWKTVSSALNQGKTMKHLVPVFNCSPSCLRTTGLTREELSSLKLYH